MLTSGCDISMFSPEGLGSCPVVRTACGKKARLRRETDR